MSPVGDLSPVAAAGKSTGQVYNRLLDTEDGSSALPFLVGALAAAVATGGQYDYQRVGPQSAVLTDRLTGGNSFQQLPQFRDVSNFNVGLFAQQAGLTLDETLRIAGTYASKMSSNSSPGSPYGLSPQTAQFTILGYQAGASGAYGQ